MTRASASGTVRKIYVVHDQAVAKTFQAHVRLEGPSLPAADGHEEMDHRGRLGDSWLHCCS